MSRECKQEDWKCGQKLAMREHGGRVPEANVVACSETLPISVKIDLMPASFHRLWMLSRFFHRSILANGRLDSSPVSTNGCVLAGVFLLSEFRTRYITFGTAALHQL